MTPAEFQALRKKANIAQYNGLGYTCWEGQLERFANLVRNATLEEAAQKCDDEATAAEQAHNVNAAYGADCCAAVLRNLKDKT